VEFAVSYSLARDDDSIEAGLRRIAQAQFGAALDALGGPVADRVSRARRALRRARSLVLLVGGAFPCFCREIEALDAADRLLDGTRDLADRIAVLRRHEVFLAEMVGAGAAEALRDRLHREAVEREALPEVVGPLIQFRVALLSAWERAGGWTISESGGAAFTEGLARTYGAAQAALEAARDEGASGFPGWRDATLAHRDHARLLACTVPGPMAAHLAMADVLAEALADHRDLACLTCLLDTLPEGEEAEAARRSFAALRAEIEPPALALGAALFAEPAAGLALRFATYWEVSRGGLLEPVAEAPPSRAIAAL
jgi:hypothetical protein